MTDAKKKPLWKNECVLLFLITSGLFVLLFSKFIFGGYAYVFTDGGSDTLQINYAQYGLFSSLFRSGESGYILQAGLGMDVSAYYPAYLIPYNLLLLLAPQRFLPRAVLAATYQKLMTISLVGYLFFRKRMDEGIGTMAAALAWTFSGYVMLWGQHYGFCTCVALFTVFMYFLQCYLDGGSRWKSAGLVIVVTMLLLSSYYFLYMTAAFAVVYVVIYSILQRRKIKDTVRNVLGLGGMGALGVMLGGAALMPILDTFLESARADVLSGKDTSSLLRPYKGRTLGTIIARFFSNQMLGIEKEYTGSVNYYEGIVLAVSILTIFAVCYFLVKKRTRIRTVIFTTLAVLLAILPVTSRILVFTTSVHRWSFMLCFVEALVIGLFIQDVCREKEKKTVLVGSILAVLLCGTMLAYVYHFPRIKVNTKAAAGVCVFLITYAVLLNAGIWIKKLQKMLPTAIMAVLVCELFVLNYPTLSYRESPTRNQMATEYYNDGTKEAAFWLKTQDDSVYRVEKSYRSTAENDGMAQGYNGLSVYMSTNQASLVDYHKMYGPKSISVNFVDFNMDDYIRSALLGAKYLITGNGYNAAQSVYTPVGEAGGKIVCENQYALPFGYLYEKEWTSDETEEMSELNKTLASLSGFYYTDAEKTGSYEKAALPEGTETSLMSYVGTATDCSMEKNQHGITVRDFGADPNVVFPEVNSCFADENKLYGLSLTMDVSEDTEMAVYYQTEGDEGFSADKVYTFTVTKEDSTWEHVFPAGLTALRVDVSTPVEYATIQDVEVKAYDLEESGYTELKESNIKDIHFSDSTYQAQVTNEESQDKMLCVPLFYQKGWTAQIDGEAVEVSNINSGLCGVEIPEGTHQISLHYEAPYERVGVGMTGVGLVIFLIVFPGTAVWKRRGKSKKADKN